MKRTGSRLHSLVVGGRCLHVVVVFGWGSLQKWIVSKLERGLSRAAGRTIFALFGSTIMVAQGGSCGEEDRGFAGTAARVLSLAGLRSTAPRSRFGAAPRWDSCGPDRRPVRGAGVDHAHRRRRALSDRARVHVSGAYFLCSQVCGASARSSKVALVWSPPPCLPVLLPSSPPSLVYVKQGKRRRKWTAQGLRHRPRWT